MRSFNFIAASRKTILVDVRSRPAT